ncbi:hypothetical protein HPP92_004798 [Vanilla planifolia]|uniref:Uncharacterized protein n=1 Tax=Vanilla planifolia TaxID=51239 RepID=A0A835RNE2_VANPL|nr:hypothetical protein HPP92_004798 [Vanilla planifolia]
MYVFPTVQKEPLDPISKTIAILSFSPAAGTRLLLSSFSFSPQIKVDRFAERKQKPKRSYRWSKRLYQRPTTAIFSSQTASLSSPRTLLPFLHPDSKSTPLRSAAVPCTRPTQSSGTGSSG